jgi:hypothetical protein
VGDCCDFTASVFDGTELKLHLLRFELLFFLDSLRLHASLTTYPDPVLAVGIESANFRHTFLIRRLLDILMKPRSAAFDSSVILGYAVLCLVFPPCLFLAPILACISVFPALCEDPNTELL